MPDSSTKWSVGRFNPFSRRKDQETPVELRPVNAQKCKVCAVLNEKGGAGKTCWTMTYARMFASDPRLIDIYGRRPRVLVIDLDPKHALTGYFGFYGPAFEEIEFRGVEQLLHHPEVDGMEPMRVADVVQKISGKDDIHLLPATDRLQAFEDRMTWLKQEMDRPDLAGTAEQAAKADALYTAERLLKWVVDAVRENYDRILIDFKPGETPLTTAGLLAADWVHVPTKLTQADIDQARDAIKLVEAFAEEQHQDLKVMAVIPMDRDPRAYQESYWLDQILRRPRDPEIPDMSQLVVRPLDSHKQFKTIIEESGSPIWKRTLRKIAGDAFDDILVKEGLI